MIIYLNSFSLPFSCPYWSILDTCQDTHGITRFRTYYNEHFIFSSKTLKDNLVLLLFSLSVMSNSLGSHGLQHTKLPCRSPSPGVCSNSCPLSWWCHPTISSSVVPFSSCLQSFPASGFFPMSQLFTSGGQSCLPFYMCTHTHSLFSLKKEGNATICDSMHGPEGQNGK